jgi:hypothetical protein
VPLTFWVGVVVGAVACGIGFAAFVLRVAGVVEVAVTALAWVVGVGVVTLVIAGRFVAVGRMLPKTLVDERRDASGGCRPATESRSQGHAPSTVARRGAPEEVCMTQARKSRPCTGSGSWSTS